jgi:hypothetical protein
MQRALKQQDAVQVSDWTMQRGQKAQNSQRGSSGCWCRCQPPPFGRSPGQGRNHLLKSLSSRSNDLPRSPPKASHLKASATNTKERQWSGQYMVSTRTRQWQLESCKRADAWLIGTSIEFSQPHENCSEIWRHALCTMNSTIVAQSPHLRQHD